MVRKKIFVGKKAGNHAYSQDEINIMIVKYAFSHGNVIRLKGGDPFVFGRGHEELEYAKSYNIEAEVIPGISSAIAVPELQHIPLTCRGIAESFWVITAVTSDGTISKDMYKAAYSDATIVILMGTAKINEIVEIFTAAGKSNTAAAVIESGSLPEEKIIVASVINIADEIDRKNIKSPAVIIVGDVVKQHLLYKKEYVNTQYEKMHRI